MGAGWGKSREVGVETCKKIQGRDRGGLGQSSGSGASEHGILKMQ